jgi:hypothetical protein
MISQKKIEDSIDRAIDFLQKNQLPWGEFKTYASWNPWFFGSIFDSSPFVTTFVLYCLKDIQEERVKKMTKKALDFLLSEQEKGGIWRFWTKRNKKKLPADLDDISTVSFILKVNGINFDDNLELILNNKNKDGLFLTWLIDEKYKKSIFWRIVEKNVDWVVNSNVLLYLGKEDRTVCSYINQVIKMDTFSSIYYPSKLSFYYVVSRAFKYGITSLGENKDKIVQSILNCQKKDGSFGNNLESALALNVLFNFNRYSKEIDLGINNLLARQSVNGSWERAVFFLGPPAWFLVVPPFYRYYGSEELTTAICIEALKNSLNIHEK